MYLFGIATRRCRTETQRIVETTEVFQHTVVILALAGGLMGARDGFMRCGEVGRVEMG